MKKYLMLATFIVLWILTFLLLEKKEFNSTYTTQSTFWCETARLWWVSIEECNALVDLFYATDWENWKDNSNRLDPNKPIFEWYWVRINNNWLYYLGLSDNKLSWELPASVGNLSKLEFLALGGNGWYDNITWIIPESIGTLSNLEELYIYNSQLEWEIPESIWNLSKLELLRLESNELIWEIPESIGNLSNLKTLNLSSNELSWELPISLWKLSQLESLWLSYNKLTWEIPESIGNLSNLEILHIPYNELKWTLPEALWNLSSLTVLNLNWNQVTWNIPESIWNLSNLWNFTLRNNNLTWKLPKSLGNLSRLQNLDLSYNEIIWIIPETFGNQLSILTLSLHDNKISWKIPESLWNLENLERLFLWNNELSWEIPESLWNLLTLESLHLNNNIISWKIPESLWSLSNLIHLYLQDNNITWKIPSSLWRLSRVEYLSLANNKITWEIPSSLWSLSNIVLLYLYDNELSWNIPSSLSKVLNEREDVKVIISWNQFCWGIPEDFMIEWGWDYISLRIDWNNLDNRSSDYSEKMRERLVENNFNFALSKQDPNKCEENQVERWAPDVDWISGAEISSSDEWILQYCQKLYPRTESIYSLWDIEISWRCERNNKNCNYSSSKPAYDCLFNGEVLWKVAFWQWKVNMHQIKQNHEDNKDTTEKKEKVIKIEYIEEELEEKQIIRVVEERRWGGGSRQKEVEYCGNWKLESNNNEDCDDWNYNNWDWCSNVCKFEKDSIEWSLDNVWKQDKELEVIVWTDLIVTTKQNNNFNMLEYIHALQLDSANEDTVNLTKYILYRISKAPKDQQKNLAQRLIHAISKLKTNSKKYKLVEFDVIVAELERVALSLE